MEKQKDSVEQVPETTDSVFDKREYIDFDNLNPFFNPSWTAETKNICNCRKTNHAERMVFLKTQEEICIKNAHMSIFYIDLCDNDIIISQNATNIDAIGNWDAKTLSYSTIYGNIFMDGYHLFHHPTSLVGKHFTIVSTQCSKIFTFCITDIQSCDIVNTALFLICCTMTV